MQQVIIKTTEAGQRFDKFLKKYLPEASGSFLYKMLRKKNIVLNEKKADGSEKLTAGDAVSFFFSEETFEKFRGNAGKAASQADTLMLQANIGLEPWSVLQQGMSKTFGITYGTAASLVGAAVIAIAFFCGESFGIGTLANIFVCPLFIDALLYLNWIPLFEGLAAGLAALLAGMELLALGTWMYMKSALGSGPRDALMVVLARKTHRSVGVCRAAVEVVIVLIGWRLGGQVGIGTVISAVGVGSLFNLNFALLHVAPAGLHQENLPETIRRLRQGSASH